jgi:hypothetical protein
MTRNSMNELDLWRPSACRFFLWRVELVMAVLSVWSLSNRQDLTVTSFWIIHMTVSSTGWLPKLSPDMWFGLIDLSIYADSYKWYESFACDTHGSLTLHEGVTAKSQTPLSWFRSSTHVHREHLIPHFISELILLYFYPYLTTWSPIQSHVTTDCQSVSPSWCRAPSESHDQN